jgi:DNA repair protein RadC
MAKPDALNAAQRRYLWRYDVTRTRKIVFFHEDVSDPPQLKTSAAVAHAFRAVVGDPPREHFLAFYLDATNRVMGYETIAIGGCASVEVEPAQVFRGAILAGAVRLIVAHNHPSGDPTPSGSDVAMTRRLLQAAELIGIPLLDHVVVASHTSYSITTMASF